MEFPQERRRFKRYAVCLPIQYQREYGLSRDRSITINVSEGGMLISARRLIDIAASILLKFLLRHEDFFLRGRVVHVQRTDDFNPYSVGVEFLARPQSFIRRLYEELEILMLYQRQCNEELGAEISLTEASVRWYRTSREWM